MKVDEVFGEETETAGAATMADAINYTVEQRTLGDGQGPSWGGVFGL